MSVKFRFARPAIALAALVIVSTAHGIGEEPADCSGTATALSIEALIDGTPTLDPVVEGQMVFYRLTVSQPLPNGCNIVGGQLSVTFPNGVTVPLAGFGGPTPDIGVIGLATPFVIVSPVPYVVTETDAVGGILTGRGDYGGTVQQPGQVNGTFQTEPEQETASATTSLPLPLADIEIVKTPGADAVCVGDEVVYTYEVTTGLGEAALAQISVTDDTCGPVVFIGGDDGDDVLQMGETWIYQCTAVITEDTTNVATATGMEEDELTTMVEAMATAFVAAVPVPQCAIDGPAEATAGTTNLAYSVMETSMPPLGNVTFEWSIMGDALFCNGRMAATGPMVCVNTAPNGTAFELWVTVTHTDPDFPDVECSSTCHMPVVLTPPDSPLDFDCFGDPDCRDCNDNDVCDADEIAINPGLDANGNTIPDECEVSCCDNGELVVLVMQYTGAPCGAVATPPAEIGCANFGPPTANAYIIANNHPDPHEPSAETWFEGPVDLGGQFEVNALNAAVSRLGSITYLHIFDAAGVVPIQTVIIDTSCQAAMHVGNQFGASLLVDCFGDDERLPCDCCFENGRPLLLTMVYTGDDCSASDNFQISADVSCQNFAPMTETVRILSTPFSDASDPGPPVWFDGEISTGDLFTMTSVGTGFNHLLMTSYIHIFAVDEKDRSETLAQTIEFHTSCSQPLRLGDRYGAALLVGCIGEDDPPPHPQIDCNANGVEDDLETALDPGSDQNGDMVPDECDLPTCPGDTNNDGVVNIDDTVNVVLDFGTSGFANGGDVDLNGIVNIDDIVLVTLAFGPCR